MQSRAWKVKIKQEDHLSWCIQAEISLNRWILKAKTYMHMLQHLPNNTQQGLRRSKFCQSKKQYFRRCAERCPHNRCRARSRSLLWGCVLRLMRDAPFAQTSTLVKLMFGCRSGDPELYIYMWILSFCIFSWTAHGGWWWAWYVCFQTSSCQYGGCAILGCFGDMLTLKSAYITITFNYHYYHYYYRVSAEAPANLEETRWSFLIERLLDADLLTGNSYLVFIWPHANFFVYIAISLCCVCMESPSVCKTKQIRTCVAVHMCFGQWQLWRNHCVSIL